MRRIFLLALLLPLTATAQVKPKTKAAPKPKTAAPAKKTDGFTISGNVKGFAEGSHVSLLNGTTGAAEMETSLVGGKFSFSGKVNGPEFKIILFNNQPPYITLFLDNSNVKITGTKETIDKATVTGSPSHKDFALFNSMLEPYSQAFNENGNPADSATFAKATSLCEKFAMEHPNAAITPLAIIRFNQLADDIDRTSQLFDALSPEVKANDMGRYLAQQLEENKKNTGVVLADFSQADTTGKEVSLSSFRGKYVLVDFWASWCGPCRMENPNVIKAYNKFKDRNFTILGVSLDKAKQAWVDAINMDGLTWTHVSDLQGWANAVAVKFGITSIPQNFLLDPEGKVIGKNLRGASLERKLARILK